MVQRDGEAQAGNMTEAPQPPPDTGPRVGRDQMRDISTLRRPTEGTMVSGVAAGLARHFDVDPILVRVLFAALTLFGGAGLFLYAIAWLTIPTDDGYHSAASDLLRRDPERIMVAGLSIAAVVTVVTMIGTIGISAPNPVPVMLVSLAALAAVALVSRRSDRLDHAPPTSTTFPAPASTTQVLPVAARPPGPPPPTPSRKLHSSRLFWVTIAVTAIALGGVWFLDEAVYGEVPLSVYPGTALGIVAVALIVGAWYGRSRMLIAVGFIASLATTGAAIIGPGPHGERTYTPTTAAEVREEYQHGAGHITVHLEEVADLDRLDGRTIDIEGAVGQIRLIVPTSLDATITAQVDGGDIDGAPSVQDFDDGYQRAVLTPTDDGDPDITINLDLRFGEIEIYRFDCAGTSASAGQSTNEWIGDDRESAACN